ncbi:MAG: helix-turn-helix domain-containing protein [Eubacteriales bacterium]
MFQKIFSCWVGKEEGYYFECISLLYKIFSEMQRKNYVPMEHVRKIQPAADAIHNLFLRENFTTDRLAAMCDMSESYFKRLFKEKYGVPPKKYIIQLKINHACELLRLERYTVTQVAEMCNFSDVYFFSRQFKEYMGITPTKFIKKYKSSK